MPVSSIDMVQTNITGVSNLMCVHNPLVFIFNATYSGTAPNLIYCRVYDIDDVLLGTYKCIPYAEVSGTIRQFIFIADSILRGLMDEFDDFVQTSGSLVHCEGFSKFFRLNFYVQYETETDLEIVALHGSRQYGDDPNAENIFENEAQTYITAEDKPVYMYIYNDDEDNVIGDDPGNLDEVILDYDDEEFADFDDELFTAITN
jgi:hypothetical protein